MSYSKSLTCDGRTFGLDVKGGFIVTVADITPEKRAESLQIERVKDAEEQNSSKVY